MINSAVSENRPEAASLIAQEASRTYLHLYLYERPYEKDEEEENHQKNGGYARSFCAVSYGC